LEGAVPALTRRVVSKAGRGNETRQYPTSKLNVGKQVPELKTLGADQE